MKLDNFLLALDSDLRLVNIGLFLDKLIKKEKLSYKQLSEDIGIPYTTFIKYITNKSSVPISVCISIFKKIAKTENEFQQLMDDLYANANKITSISSKAKNFKIPKVIDNDLAYLIGAIHDGCVFKNELKNQYVVQYWQYHDKEWLTQIANMLEQIFGIRPKEYTYYIQLAGKPVFEVFNKVLMVPTNQAKWDSCLRNFPWEYQKRIIAGFFDAEGWCGKNYDLRLKFTQNNKRKLKELKQVLEEHGIKCGAIIKDRTSSAVFVCGKNCLAFYNQVGVYCKKRSKLERLKSITDIF